MWKTFLVNVLPIFSDCVPENALMFTITNNHHKEITDIMIQSLDECVRMKTVLYFASSSCKPSSHIFCGSHMIASDWRKGEYEKIVWLKWKLIHDALDVAKAIFYVDTDIIFFKNPWPVLHQYESSFDIAYQQEIDTGHMNSGQILIMSLNLTREILKLEPNHLHNKNMMDQQIVERYLTKSKFRHTTLPLSFLGNCMFNANKSLMNKETITYHASCSGNKHDKMKLLKRMRKFSITNILVKY